MKNILLGKTVKAMYKLSGKTLQQLSDETELTVDTINNLFYARIQKPGFAGVCALVNACGYRVEDLTGFLARAEKLPEDADITAEFTKYLMTAEDTAAGAHASVPSAGACTYTASDTNGKSGCQRMNAMQESYERQLDQIRSAHIAYVDQLNERYREQIGKTEKSAELLKEHFDHSVGEIKKAHGEELGRQSDEIKQLRRMNLFLSAALVVLCVLGMVLAWVVKL
ncbi:MAG: hypothetical protein KBT31_02450 [Firmicutes bacterium]|nr:hypothetical protein [Candidatus Colimorpha enterica]